MIGALGLITNLFGAEMHLADGGAPFRLGWREEPLSFSPAKALKSEPAYKSDHVLYMTLRLGSGDAGIIAGVLDESQGSGKGYDTLYLDANNNGDLTDDPVIKPQIARAGSAISLTTDALDVIVKYAGGTQRKLRVKLEIRGGSRQKSLSENVAWLVGYQVDQHLEGTVNIGGRKDVLIGIYDSSSGQKESNGCFDDYCVDRIRIDLNGDGQLDAKTEDFPLSRAICVDGRLWQIEFDSAMSVLNVKPCTLPTGKIKFEFNMAKTSGIDRGTIELVSDGGYGFRIALPEKENFTAPECSYRISNASVVFDGSDGRKWSASLALSKSLILKHDDNFALVMGGSLRLGLTCKGNLMPGGEVCIMPLLTGAAGEVYENIALAGTRMAPSVKIVDAENIVIAESKMDYG